METKSTFDIKSIAAKISDGLKTAQKEIEEMALQFSLGKADAADKFEEIKKEFNARINEWKSRQHSLQEKALLEELQAELASGRADAKETFAEQRKKILSIVSRLEEMMRKNPQMNEHLDEFRSEIEKLKIKLEILRLKFELKSFEVKEGFKDEMNDARIEIDKLLSKVEEKWDKAKSKYSDFSEEIDQAFQHFKKGCQQL